MLIVLLYLEDTVKSKDEIDFAAAVCYSYEIVQKSRINKLRQIVCADDPACG